MDLALDAKKTALVVIDLEPGIVERPGLAPYSGPDVVARARKLADGLRAKGGTVVWVHVLLHEIVRLPVDRPMQGGSTPPPASASELVPEIGLQADDVVIAKRQWGAFYGTNLEQTLDRRGIETIIMAGIATNAGVESTARAAYDAGYCAGVRGGCNVDDERGVACVLDQEPVPDDGQGGHDGRDSSCAVSQWPENATASSCRT